MKLRGTESPPFSRLGGVFAIFWKDLKNRGHSGPSEKERVILKLRSRLAPEIITFPTRSGRFLGFHTRNLEVAELSPELWQDLEQNRSSEGLRALQEWNDSINPELRRDPTTGGTLSSLTLNVTQVCNLACTYCAAGGNGTYGDPIKKMAVEQALPQLKMLMGRAQPGSPFLITFLGGEPLLYPEGIRVLAEVAREIAATQSLHLQFAIVTNGTRFSPSNIALLKDLRADVTLSMDGPPDLSDRQRVDRKGEGVGQKVLAGLHQLLQDREGLSSVGISGVFGGAPLELEAAWRFYRSLPVDWFDFTYDHHQGSEAASLEFTRTLASIAEQAFHLGGEDELRKIRTFNRYFEALDRQQQTENHCGAGKTFLMIDARQQITTCPWLVGEAREVVGVGPHLWEERLEAFAAPLIEKNNCGQCWARYLCGGGCLYVHRQRTGDKHEVDPLFCGRMKGILEVTLELYLEARRASFQNDQNQVERSSVLAEQGLQEGVEA